MAKPKRKRESSDGPRVLCAVGSLISFGDRRDMCDSSLLHVYGCDDYTNPLRHVATVFMSIIETLSSQAQCYSLYVIHTAFLLLAEADSHTILSLSLSSISV